MCVVFFLLHNVPQRLGRSDLMSGSLPEFGNWARFVKNLSSGMVMDILCSLGLRE